MQLEPVPRLILVVFRALERPKAPELSIVIDGASALQLPVLPLGDAVLTSKNCPKSILPPELVLMLPPFPDNWPPVAFKIPATLLTNWDQTSIFPPLPVLVAETSTTAPWAMFTVSALTSACTKLVLFLETVLPISTSPPPFAAVAEVLEPLLRLT